jgi:hypothetical protein
LRPQFEFHKGKVTWQAKQQFGSQGLCSLTLVC